MLSLLVQRPGDLVAREELHKELWPADTFVEFDQGLNTAIKKIRVALGDSADNPRFVDRAGVYYGGSCPFQSPLFSTVVN